MNPQLKPLFEIFESIASAKNKAERVKILKDHNFLHVRDVLRGAYDNQIQWDLPEGCPPYEEYEPAVKEGNNGNLRKATKKLAYLVTGGPGKNLSNVKRETMWLSIIETLHPKDVDILVLMKDKELAGVYKGLTKALVREVWPGLIRD